MPTAAAANPKCHEIFGSIPRPASVFLNCSLCASQPTTSGAMKAPTLMPM